MQLRIVMRTLSHFASISYVYFSIPDTCKCACVCWILRLTACYINLVPLWEKTSWTHVYLFIYVTAMIYLFLFNKVSLRATVYCNVAFDLWNDTIRLWYRCHLNLCEETLTCCESENGFSLVLWTCPNWFWSLKLNIQESKSAKHVGGWTWSWGGDNKCLVKPQ